MTIFYSLTALGAFRPLTEYDLNVEILYADSGLCQYAYRSTVRLHIGILFVA
jgi:hypothetical protein